MRIARGEDGRLPAPDAGKPLPAEITQRLQPAHQIDFWNAIDRALVRGRISAAPAYSAGGTAARVRAVTKVTAKTSG